MKGIQNVAGRVVSLRFEILRVCQEVFKISLVGSGRGKRLQNIAGRVGSGQEVSKSRGSGWVGPRGVLNLAGLVGSLPARYGSLRGSSHDDPRIVLG